MEYETEITIPVTVHVETYRKGRPGIYHLRPEHCEPAEQGGIEVFVTDTEGRVLTLDDETQKSIEQQAAEYAEEAALDAMTDI